MPMPNCQTLRHRRWHILLWLIVNLQQQLILINQRLTRTIDSRFDHRLSICDHTQTIGFNAFLLEIRLEFVLLHRHR